MSVTEMAGAWWVWPVAFSFYLLFSAWYDNWRGPLTAQEVEEYLRLARAAPGAQHTDLTVLRHFLSQDDGREFVMCNLVRLQPQEVPHPLTGAPTQPRELLQEYFGAFLLTLFQHGGHPLIASRKIAGYVDAWNTPPDPGWTMAAMMRYRSRRDMMELTLDPRFTNAYPFKAAAVEQTYSFPTQVLSTMVLGPRSAVALLLALLAALLQLLSVLL